MPQPLNDTQCLVLAETWQHLVETGCWPTFAQLDRRLYRNHDIEADDILVEMPVGLLASGPHGWDNQPNDSQEIGLTIAGIHATGQARQELDLFVWLVRLAADLERYYRPSAEEPEAHPVLVASVVANQLGLPAGDAEGLLGRLGAILRVEPWGWTSATREAGPDWEFQIDRQVRPFRTVADVDAYWQRRPKPWLGQAPAADTPPTPMTTARASSSEDTDYRSPNPAAARLSAGDAIQIALAGVATALGGLALGWNLLRTASLIGATVLLVLVWHVRRLNGQRLQGSVLSAAVLALILLGLLIATFLP